MSVQDLEKQFESLVLGLFNSNNYILEKHLERQQVLLAVEGSRRFRPPTGLGMMRYEGCAIAVFAHDLGDLGDSFMKDSAGRALEGEEIEGQKVTVFKRTSEQDVWTFLVAFPQRRVVTVCTNGDYLQEVLRRMRGIREDRALPETLPEWKYVEKQTPFWGLRHFDRTQAREDPTSPFRGEKYAYIPDEQAIGLVFSCDPNQGRAATVTYLSGSKNILQKIEQKLFPSASEPEATKGLHIRYREVEPGVIEGSFDLSHSEPSQWFFFVLLGELGHAIYL